MGGQLELWFIIASQILFSFSIATDYCTLNSKHLYCEAASHEKDKKCGETSNITFTDDMKEQILRIFNSFRQDLAVGDIDQLRIFADLYTNIKLYGNFNMPLATNMIQLEWHDELQKAAQKITELCNEDLKWCYDCLHIGGMPAIWTYNHLPMNDLSEAYRLAMYKEGQNFGALEYSKYSTEGKTKTGFVLPYRWKNESFQFLSAAFHSKTRFIGCGRIKSSKPDMEYFETCLFAPLPEEEITILYTMGTPCSKCPTRSICSDEYKGLCTYKTGSVRKNINYCDFHKKHILCDEWTRDKKLCQGVTPIEITESDKYEILTFANKIRRDLAVGRNISLKGLPKAADMIELKWDMTLQDAAEKLKYICPSEESLTPEQLRFGNKGQFQSMIIDILHNGSHFEVMKLKELEVIEMDQTLLTKYKQIKNHEELSALVFSQTRYMGCSRWNLSINLTGPSEVHDICLFASPRNMDENVSDPLYIAGKECSKCQDGYTCHRGLCRIRIEGIDGPEDYCNIDKKHILCNQWDWAAELGNPALCQGKTKLKMKEETKAEILRSFNQFRRDLAIGKDSILRDLPTATNMLELEWDDELQKAAERILHSCSTKNLTSGQLEFGNIGELQANIIRLRHNGTNFDEKLLKIIRAEGKLFDPNRLYNYSDIDMQDIFSSVTSSQARYIGCARITPTFEPNGSEEIEEVCIIGPGEKNNDGMLYESGEPCANCPEDFECDDGLCQSRHQGIDKPRDYCKLEKLHILCEDTNGGIDRDLKSQIPESGKVNLLSTLNTFRRDLAFGNSDIHEDLPKAADMNEIFWDSELEEAATRILNKFDEKKIPPNELKFGHHGELQATVFKLKSNLTDFENAFQNELKKEGSFFQLSHLENYTASEKYDMFTSLAFSKVRFLGCAQRKSSNESNEITSICVVGPTEKKDGSNILYQKGLACSKCQIGFECNDGLCIPTSSWGIVRPNQYCDISAEHILCTNWDPKKELGQSDVCAGKMLTRITEPIKLEILNTFNKFRWEIANGTSDVISQMPMAANMFKMEWNNELQRAAQKILHSCIPVESVTSNMLSFGHHGELQTFKTLLIHDGTNFEEELMKLLKTEAANFKVEDLNNYKADEKYDMFTAMAFSNATFLGCARREDSQKTNSANKVEDLCIIGPIGKAENNQLFLQGEGCSRCPPRSDCDDLLCKPIEVGIDKPADYCDVSARHLLCEEKPSNDEAGYTTTCESDTSLPSTTEEKANILINFNQFRREIANNYKSSVFQSNFQVANMIELEYDYELERAAEKLLSRCDADAVSPDMLKFGHHGELQANKVIIKHDGSNFLEALKKAVEEEAKASNKLQLDDYDKSVMSQIPFNGIIPPLISSESRYLGCVKRRPLTGDDPAMVTEVCIIGGSKIDGNKNSLYEKGTACSKCFPVYKCAAGICRSPPSTNLSDSLIDLSIGLLSSLLPTTTPGTTSIPTLAVKVVPIISAFEDSSNYDEFVPQFSPIAQKTTAKSTTLSGSNANKSKSARVKFSKFIQILFLGISLCSFFLAMIK